VVEGAADYYSGAQLGWLLLQPRTGAGCRHALEDPNERCQLMAYFLRLMLGGLPVMEAACFHPGHSLHEGCAVNHGFGLLADSAGRLTKKERKRTLTEEIMADTELAEVSAAAVCKCSCPCRSFAKICVALSCSCFRYS
jgi:hypothetical protein